MENKETLEDFIKRESKSANESVGIVKGSKWQQEQDKKMYSEEDMMFAYEQGARLALISQSDLARVKGKFPTPREWFDDLKTNKIWK
jgi:hypothetical protein